jgi:hypothetical protein
MTTIKHLLRPAAALLFLASLSLSGCAAKVYMLDRQTVLEEEAAGEWPDMESRLKKQAKVSGATPFPAVEQSAAKKRRYSVLNGEATTELQSSEKTAKQ